MRELILWGIPAGSNDAIDAVILCTQAKTQADIEQVKVAAARDGFHSFTVQTIDGTLPDFAGTVVK